MEQQVLDKIHKIEQEILDEIDRICKEENISYFLVGGTLLGAIRHKGFIPWDDDLDIGMPRKDFEKFIDVCSKKLNEKFVLHWYNTDNNYWLTFAKIRRNNTCYIEKSSPQHSKYCGLWVDIFPLDYSDGKDKKSEQIKCKILYKLRGYLLALGIGRDKADSSKKLKNIIKLMDRLHITNKNFLKFYCFVARRKKIGKFLMNYGSQYGIDKQMILSDKYFPAKRIEFEGKLYSGPQDPDYILTQIYGKDYMQLPPMEKRRTHKPKAISFNCERE